MADKPELKTKFSEGGMWEDPCFEIEYDVDVEVFNKCRHCGPVYKEVHVSFSGSTFTTEHVNCPAVVVARNEGGHNSTGVCLQCIMEAAARCNLTPSGA